MKCEKCGTELPDGAKFCSHGGHKTETKQQEKVVNVENTATKTNYPVVETQKKETIVDKAKEKGISFWKQRSRLGKVATISLALFSLFAFIALVSGKVGAVIVSLLAIGLTVVGILMKRQVIKVKKTWLPLLSIILSFVLVLPYFSFFGSDASGREKYNWDEVVLADILPQPVSPYGEIISNSEDYLSMDITETTQDQYKDYIVGRMGIPYRQRGVNLISIVVDAPGDAISTLAGKVGMLQGVSAKTLYAKLPEGAQ